ncbi:hypothetical protein MC885_021496, partial [Smutsia gigantea]
VSPQPLLGTSSPQHPSPQSLVILNFCGVSELSQSALYLCVSSNSCSSAYTLKRCAKAWESHKETALGENA